MGGGRRADGARHGAGPYIAQCEAFDLEYDGDIDMNGFSVCQSLLADGR